MLYLPAILGLAILMIVHECGHYFGARAFGMRVERFSIGFGPPIWRHQPKGSDTVFQVALIPFLAYVQIAGMNPFEEIDPQDKGSYANASLTGRIVAIVAGPLANYLFASVVFFAAMVIGGKYSEEPLVTVVEASAAEAAGVRSGDRILAIDGKSVRRWDEIPELILPKAGQDVRLTLARDGSELGLSVHVREQNGKGFLGVSKTKEPMPMSEALTQSIVQPAVIVGLTVVSLGKMLTGQEEGQLTGPIGIMRETKKAAELGLPIYLSIIGFLSTSVGFFNMLPLPALDGGRLMFLGYEAITRRRPNQKFEAQIHMAGMLLLLTALLLVSFREWGSDKTPSEEAATKRDRAAQKEQPSGTAVPPAKP
jgi:regulator of sigma E protease